MSESFAYQLSLSNRARSEIKGHQPCILWLTGFSGSGKSTIANLIEQKLNAFGHHTYLIDGDNIRVGLNSDLGFSYIDRTENNRRIAEVAKLMADAGLIVITASISPFRKDREAARLLAGDIRFFEIFVDTPLEVAESRDPKGLYKLARRGNIKDFTGIDSVYERPIKPELTLDTTIATANDLADHVLFALDSQRIFSSKFKLRGVARSV